MSVIVPDSQISMALGLQRLGVQQSSIQMCIFICLPDSTKMSLPNQVRQRSSQFSGFSFTLRRINHSPDEYAESLRIIPESSSLNPCYILLSLFLPKLSSVCFSSLLTSTKSLNSMCHLQQTRTPMMCQGPYIHCASKTAMKQTRKKKQTPFSQGPSG